MSDIKEKEKDQLADENLNDHEETLDETTNEEIIEPEYTITLPDDLDEKKEETTDENSDNTVETEESHVIEGLTEEEKVESKEKTLKLQLYELELKIEECDVQVEELEVKLYADPEDDDAQTKYLEVKSNLKELNKEKKKLQKELNLLDDSSLNKVSVWVIIYGLITILISFPLLSAPIWLDFANYLIEVFQGSFANLDTVDLLYKIVVFLIIFAFPLIINVVTWLLHNNFIKSKVDKITFDVMWIIQGVMSLGMIIYMCTKLFQ